MLNDKAKKLKEFLLKQSEFRDIFQWMKDNYLDNFVTEVQDVICDGCEDVCNITGCERRE